MHIARHPPLMDVGHYSSWGQVPLTIKGPSQWLGKNESGKRREEGKRNCCRRTSKHKHCRESRHETSGEVERKVGAQQVDERQMAGALFFLCVWILSVIQHDCLATKTVITQAKLLLTGAETLCFVSFSTVFSPQQTRSSFSVCLPDSCRCLAALFSAVLMAFCPNPVSELWGQILPLLPQGHLSVIGTPPPCPVTASLLCYFVTGSHCLGLTHFQSSVHGLT